MVSQKHTKKDEEDCFIMHCANPVSIDDIKVEVDCITIKKNIIFILFSNNNISFSYEFHNPSLILV